MVDNEKLQAALISRLKALPNIVAELSSADEIREYEYQGTTFSYPNVRLRIIRNEPISHAECYHRISFGVMVFAEGNSSIKASHISGIIAEELGDTYFTSEGVTINARLTNIVPALRSDARTWRSEVLFIGTAS